MNSLIDFVLRQRVLVLIGGLVILIAGVIVWNRLPIDAFPDVTNVQVVILTEAEGLAPVDVEQQITFPIETVMGGLPHVVQVRSLSKSGLSQVVVTFEDEVDVYFARQQVAERLQLAREQLPAGVEPEMGPISTGLGEIFQYTLESEEHSLTELRTLQDWIVAPQLRAIPGVTEVNSFGGFVRQIHVLVNPEKLLKYDLTLHDVFEAVAANNANAGGNFIIEDWEQAYVRSVGQVTSVDDIKRIVLTAKDGTPVFLSSVADVVEGHQTRQGAVSRDGKGEVVAGMVIMLKGENSKAVVDRVKAAIPNVQASLPEGVTLNPFYDRTNLIQACIGTVSNALAQGGIFVVLVLFLFLGSFRVALTVALSLPMTALIAFILMGWQGVTANLMSLGGLAIAIGMVVDASIVVAENVMRHFSDKRKELIGASQAMVIATTAEAVKEVVRPIVFAILIIIIVFFPLFTLEGMEGKMFGPLALTMVFAMLGSLLVALTLVPVVSSYLLRGKPEKSIRGDGRDDSRGDGRGDGQGDGSDGLSGRLRTRYLAFLNGAIERRGVTLGAAAAIFIGAVALLPYLGTEFLPKLDEGAIAINVVRLPTASLDGSVSVAGFIERELREFPEVQTVVSKTGRAEISEDPMGPEQNDILIMLAPEDEWTTGRTKEELISAIQQKLSVIPGLRLSFSQPIALRVNELISGVKSDLAVKIFGPSLDVLKDNADKAAAILGTIHGAEDVKVEQVSGFSQIEVVPDRRVLARYKLNIEDVNEVVETAVGGKVATTLIDGQKRFAVLVRYPAHARQDIEALERILVPSPVGARVPLGRIAVIRKVEAPAQISRENNMRRIVVETNVRGRDLGSFVKEAQTRLSALTKNLPAGYWIEYGGTFENQQRAMQRLSVVVPVSILLIFVLLLSAFGSLRDAALVLVNLPFALAGGIVSMVLFDIPLSVSAAIGFITLFGIAVENGTVLVTFFGQLRERGYSLRQAVVEGCSLRFRALSMTALTTVLGLIPMLYASGAGAEIQRPLAVVVIGGLVTSTLLTLVVLPTLYYLVESRRSRLATSSDLIANRPVS